MGFSLATCKQTLSQGPAQYFDSRARKNKSVLLFPLKKKSERERKEDVVERNSSPSATALLNPYARLRGRKYPQFSVIRGRGRLPHWKGPGGTDWAPLRQARAEYASL